MVTRDFPAESEYTQMANETITTQDAFRAAIAEVIARTDFNAIGQVKPHLGDEEIPGDRNSRKETGEFFLTATTRMPSGTAVRIDGVDWYPNSLQVKLDAFKLAEQPKGETTTTKAATVSNAELLRQRRSALGGAVPNGGKPVVAKAPAKASQV